MRRCIRHNPGLSGWYGRATASADTAQEEDRKKKEEEVKELVRGGTKRKSGGSSAGKGEKATESVPKRKRTSGKGKEKKKEKEADEEGKGKLKGRGRRIAKRRGANGKAKGKSLANDDQEGEDGEGDEGKKEEEVKELVREKKVRKEDWRKVGFVGRGLSCYSDDACLVHTLPEETLLLVFQFLDLVSLSRSSMVCTAWFNVCFDKSMRRILDFSEQNQEVCARTRSSHIKRIVTHCPHLTVVNLRGVAQVTDATIKVIFTHCKELRYLNCWNAQKLTDLSLYYIGQMTTLQGLDIASCPKMDHNAITKSIEGLTNLQSLNLSGHKCDMYDHISVPPAVLSGLQHLELEGCPVDFESLEQHGKNLTLLNLRLCTSHDEEYRKKPNVFLLPKLTDFYAEHPTWLANLYDILETGTPLLLRLLYLDCTRLPSNGLIMLVQLCDRLQYLSLQYSQNVDDALLAVLAHNCSKLEQLFVTGCDAISAKGITSLREEAHQLLVLSVGDIPAALVSSRVSMWAISECNAFKEELVRLVGSKPHCTLTYREERLAIMETICALKPELRAETTSEHILREGRNARKRLGVGNNNWLEGDLFTVRW